MGQVKPSGVTKKTRESPSERPPRPYPSGSGAPRPSLPSDDPSSRVSRHSAAHGAPADHAILNVMRSLRAPGPALLLTTLLLPAAAAAHEFWLLPDSFAPAVGQRVAVRVFVGDGFEHGEPYPRNPRHIRSFWLEGERATPIEGASGDEPAGSFIAATSGAQMIGYRSNASNISLAAEPFESYLVKEGLEHVLRLRAQAGETLDEGREAFSRCAKSLIRVGNGPTDGYDRPLGLDLEIVPTGSPFGLEAGSTLPVLVLWQGEPLAGAQIRAFAEGHPDRTFEVRTGDDGTTTLTLDPAGTWMLSVVHMERAAPGSDVDWQSTWSSLTFRIDE